MKKILLILASFICFSLNGMERSVSPYKESPVDIKFRIFTTLIDDTSTIPELNATIRNFAQWDKENLALVKTENRFKNAIKNRKAQIQKPLLQKAQEIIDKIIDFIEKDAKRVGASHEHFYINVLKDGPNAKGDHDYPALIFAADQKDPNLLKILIDAGADPDSRYVFSTTALMHLFSIHGGGVKVDDPKVFEMAKILVDAGANLNIIETAHNTTVLDDALLHNKAVAQLLIEHGGKTAQQIKKECIKNPNKSSCIIQ